MDQTGNVLAGIDGRDVRYLEGATVTTRAPAASLAIYHMRSSLNALRRAGDIDRAAQLEEMFGELRAAGDVGDPIPFEGVCALMETPTVIGGKYGWVEQIETGAFDDSLKADDQRLLKNHNTDLPLARVSAGTNRYEVDGTKLRNTAEMDPVSYAYDLAVSLERKTITGMSIGFRVKSDQWTELPEDHEMYGKTFFNEFRQIHLVQLAESSPVTFPAYVSTEAGLRHAAIDAVIRGIGLDDKTIAEAARALRAGDMNAFRQLCVAGDTTEPAIARTAPAIAPDQVRDDTDLLDSARELCVGVRRPAA